MIINKLQKLTHFWNEERRSINEKYLSKKQVEGLIRFYERSNNTRTRDYIEIFLFSLLMGGMRVSDIVTLEWKHIDFETKTLTKLQIKTRRILRIPIVDEAIEILNRWKKKKVNHRFVFNLLSSRFDLNNPEVLRTAILSKNRMIQQSLRNVGEKMGLTFNLTMHCARHTFAILALQSNVPVYQVIRLMGHTTINTVQLTYARFIPIDESEKALGKIGFGGFISLS